MIHRNGAFTAKAVRRVRRVRCLGVWGYSAHTHSPHLPTEARVSIDLLMAWTMANRWTSEHRP